MGAQLQPGSQIRWCMQRALGSGVLCPGDTEPERVQERLYIKKEVGRRNHYRIAASLSQSVASPKLHLQLLRAWDDDSSFDCPTYRRDSKWHIKERLWVTLPCPNRFPLNLTQSSRLSPETVVLAFQPS